MQRLQRVKAEAQLGPHHVLHLTPALDRLLTTVRVLLQALCWMTHGVWLALEKPKTMGRDPASVVEWAP